MIPKRYDKFGTVKILTVSRKQWYKNFENPSKFIFIVHPLHTYFVLTSLTGDTRKIFVSNSLGARLDRL